MPEPPLKICVMCRGRGGDCEMCNGRGVGVPVEEITNNADRWEWIVEPDGSRYVRERSEHEVARLRRQRKPV